MKDSKRDKKAALARAISLLRLRAEADRTAAERMFDVVYSNVVKKALCQGAALDDAFAETLIKMKDDLYFYDEQPATFEAAWAQMELRGFNYGSDALENVRFGWEIGRGLEPDGMDRKRADDRAKFAARGAELDAARAKRKEPA